MTGDRAPGTSDDTGCHILHVDMDAFYASVEVRDRPGLAGTPVIVGAAGGRSVVLSATYEARAFGVRSAMPMSRARRLCPQAVIIPPRHGLYAAVSREVMAVFGSVTPEVEPLALDEAFLDVSGALRRLGGPAQIGELIRATIGGQQGITCSVGVAPCKFIAKLASTAAKPDGLLVIPADGILDFLHPLPVSALWGVGERTGRFLASLGLRTVADIAHEKSIGAEETFASDVDDPEVIRRELLRLSGRTARGLRRAGCAARTVVVKLRLADFTTITRSRTLPEPTDLAQEIYATSCELYAAAGLDARARLRLVGVRATGLVASAAAESQLAFGDRPASWREAERALDMIAGRFGTDAVRPAALVDGSRPDGNPPGGAGPAGTGLTGTRPARPDLPGGNRPDGNPPGGAGPAGTGLTGTRPAGTGLTGVRPAGPG